MKTLKKKSAKTRRRKATGKQAARLRVVLVPTDEARPSPYARRVLRVFQTGVDKALRDFSDRGIAVTVGYGDRVVRGVPVVTGKGVEVGRDTKLAREAARGRS
jgi:hypothetical protein